MKMFFAGFMSSLLGYLVGVFSNSNMPIGMFLHYHTAFLPEAGLDIVKGVILTAIAVVLVLIILETIFRFMKKWYYVKREIQRGG